MPSVKLSYPVMPGVPLLVEIPQGVTSGTVEVTIHLSENSGPARRPILEMMEELATRPVRRTAEEIDAALAEQRASWE